MKKTWSEAKTISDSDSDPFGTDSRVSGLGTHLETATLPYNQVIYNIYYTQVTYCTNYGLAAEHNASSKWPDPGERSGVLG